MIDYHNLTYLETAANFTPGYDLHVNEETYSNVKNGSYAIDLFSDAAVDVIGKSDKSKPFLMVLSHSAAHSGHEYDLFRVPEDEVERFDYIVDLERRKLAAMMSRLDDSVGRVVEKLKEKGVLHNTIILFMSGNGAPSDGFLSNSGSNHPLRGVRKLRNI